MNDRRKRYLQIAQTALERYDIGDPRFNESEEVGDIGFNGYGMVKFYLESKSDPFLINVHDAYQGRNIRDYRNTIRSHLLWLDALDRDTDLTVQTPVRNRSDDLVTEIEPEGHSPVLVTLLHWVQGELVWDNYEDTPIVDLSPEILSTLGSVLAKLHRHSSRWERPEKFTRPDCESEDLPENLGRMRRAVDDGRISTADFTLLEKTVDQIQLHIGELGRSDRTWGLLHGDFSGGNCVLHQGNIRPIDFDWCCFGYYMSDLGRAFVSPKMTADQRRAFLDGYGREGTLSSGSLRTIESFFIEWIIRWQSWSADNPKADYESIPRFVEKGCRKYLNGEPFLLDWAEEL